MAAAAATLLAAAPAAHAQLPPLPPPGVTPPPSQPAPPSQPSQPAPPPSPAQSHPKPAQQLRGVQMHPLWQDATPAATDRMLQIARDAGATVVRVDVAWASLELTGRGRINWPYLGRADAFVRQARQYGMQVIVTLGGTPCWAARAPADLRRGCRGPWWERGVPAYPPARARDFGHLAAWIAARWQGQIAALEIWNEPNQPFFLRSRDPARAYGRLLRASYKPIKRAAPGVRVLAGAISYSDGDFLDALYERGRIGGYYDALSYHPYTDGRDPRAPAGGSGRRTSFVDGTAWLREVMAAHGDGGELWITEAGASTCSGRPTCVDEATQADYVRNYLQTAEGMPFVRAVVVYAMRDNATPSTSEDGRFGLLRYDLQPKPAFAAFREALAR